MKKLHKILISTSILMLIAIPVSAHINEMTKHGNTGMKHHGTMGHGIEHSAEHKSHGNGHHDGHKMGQHRGHAEQHGAYSWEKTFTDEQKLQSDTLHLRLKKALSTPNAQLNVKKVELSHLVLEDRPDKKVISRKIAEILELKRKIMQKSSDHMLNLRSILNAEQKMSFDMKH